MLLIIMLMIVLLHSSVWLFTVAAQAHDAQLWWSALVGQHPRTQHQVSTRHLGTAAIRSDFSPTVKSWLEQHWQLVHRVP
jgi:hypothetical protein